MSPDRHRGAGGQFTQVGRFGGMTGTPDGALDGS
jgi:hypothetical protein